MEEKVKAAKLSLKKEIITKLSSEQMKMVAGGAANDDVENLSCRNDSCNSQVDAGSCLSHSCFCGA